MITSTVANKYAVMRSFGSSSVLDLSSSGRPRNVEKP